MEKPLTLAVIINQIEARYNQLIWKNFINLSNSLFSDRNIKCLFFIGDPRDTNTNAGSQNNAIYSLINENIIDGIIMISGQIREFDKLNKLDEFISMVKNIPIVTIGAEIKDYPYISVNNRSAINDLCSHLINVHKCNSIAFIKGPVNSNESNERFEAYKECLEKNGFEFNHDFVIQGDFSFISGYNAIETLYDKRKVFFDSIIAANDDMALGAINALQEKGINIPKEIKVVGFDDVEECLINFPPLTTIHQPINLIIQKSIDVILDMINGKKVELSYKLDYSAIVRESCGCFSLDIQKVKSISDIAPSEEIYTLENLIKYRDDIIDKIEQELNKDTGKSESSEFRRWSSILFHMLIHDIEMDYESDDFLSCFNDIVNASNKRNIEVNMWGYYLNILRFLMYQHITDEKLLKRLNTIFYKTQILYREILLRLETEKKIITEKKIYEINQVSMSILASFDVEELIEELSSQLPRLKINNCYIVFYKNPNPLTGFSKISKKGQLIMSFQQSKKDIIPETTLEFDINQILPEPFFSHPNNCSMIFMPLFFQKNHFGYIVFGLKSISDISYETLRSHISSVIQGAFLFKKQKETEKTLRDTLSKLKHSNQKLEDIAITDELTGLYNRRGFLTFGKHHFSLAVRKKEKFTIFFADMDGLKQINDIHGHEEGDYAIKQMAGILVYVFRKTDIIARLGGDEFTILALNTSLNEVPIIIERLKLKIDEVNEIIKKAYKIDISVGYAPFEIDQSIDDFEELMKMADNELYKQKKIKKANFKK